MPHLLYANNMRYEDLESVDLYSCKRDTNMFHKVIFW
jgi:hypothetical protein